MINYWLHYEAHWARATSFQLSEMLEQKQQYDFLYGVETAHIMTWHRYNLTLWHNLWFVLWVISSLVCGDVEESVKRPTTRLLWFVETPCDSFSLKKVNRAYFPHPVALINDCIFEAYTIYYMCVLSDKFLADFKKSQILGTGIQESTSILWSRFHTLKMIHLAPQHAKWI